MMTRRQVLELMELAALRTEARIELAEETMDGYTVQSRRAFRWFAEEINGLLQERL